MKIKLPLLGFGMASTFFVSGLVFLHDHMRNGLCDCQSIVPIQMDELCPAHKARTLCHVH
jgi:hypothetical protein